MAAFSQRLAATRPQAAQDRTVLAAASRLDLLWISGRLDHPRLNSAGIATGARRAMSCLFAARQEGTLYQRAVVTEVRLNEHIEVSSDDRDHAQAGKEPAPTKI